MHLLDGSWQDSQSGKEKLVHHTARERNRKRWNVGNTRPDLSKVGNRLECNMSLTRQMSCYGSSEVWVK